jgi:hypothetical protein
LYEGGLAGRHPKAAQHVPGKARLNGHWSDEWLFGDGIDGVGKTLFKPRAKPPRREKRHYFR